MQLTALSQPCLLAWMIVTVTVIISQNSPLPGVPTPQAGLEQRSFLSHTRVWGGRSPGRFFFRAGLSVLRGPIHPRDLRADATISVCLCRWGVPRSIINLFHVLFLNRCKKIRYDNTQAEEKKDNWLIIILF